jgi:hypothetical protein
VIVGRRRNPVAPALARAAEEIARASAKIGERVLIDVDRVADRSDSLDLKAPGVWSPNRSCRLVAAADGWIAVNMARPDDADLIPAWVGRPIGSHLWPAIQRAARRRPWRRLVSRARLVGLPIAGLGELGPRRRGAKLYRRGAGDRRGGPLKVLDLSSLWAGPLCGSILAMAGASVMKLESRTRPDALWDSSPEFFSRLNGAKTLAAFDITRPNDVDWLRGKIVEADVLITSARPRAFLQAGLEPDRLFAANPRLVWVAVTGYGWRGQGSGRVAFGDDAAVAGGLVRWTPLGRPRFLGDALADPLTGLAAAAGALRALAEGGGFLVDASLAGCAAEAAALLGA